MNPTPVVFCNNQGHRLFGVLHEPDANIRKSTGIILLSPGVKMRVAPHRMYNKMAGCFVKMGFPVLRFDFFGLGDSEGEIEMKQLTNVYNSIQLGRYVEDTFSSLDWMQKELGISNCIVGGLCGGAITGMLASEHDQRIAGLLAVGIPVTLDVGAENWAQHLSEGQLAQMRTGYFRNLCKPQSWIRLLTFQSNYSVIWKSLEQHFAGKVVPTPTAVAASAAECQEKDNTNPRFAPAFLNMLRRSRPMLHIFSGSDRLAWEFEEKFASYHRNDLEMFAASCEIHTIDKANHVLAHPDWFNEMLAISQDWLARFQ